ncbi:uncharacterized protein BX664DRAFT_332190 [Halteromyces radiatus]|uniref:uncharacterized protein n=1 Tax=Halteromyces radiatus TaxID=101107 RepID=UPI0022202230|nr:uncharacterized protein BX664DRAFT_332190 [Halteromyces radiatus]KAI8089109.1 hypothetical protein BX664DRAFT_332190 [Halteromyces radiatus]
MKKISCPISHPLVQFLTLFFFEGSSYDDTFFYINSYLSLTILFLFFSSIRILLKINTKINLYINYTNIWPLFWIIII